MGESVFVVAVFLDVRGFSRFAGIAEPVRRFFLKRFLPRSPDGIPARTTRLRRRARRTDGDLRILGDRCRGLHLCRHGGCVRLMDDYPAWIVGDPTIIFRDSARRISESAWRDAATRIATPTGESSTTRVGRSTRPRGLWVLRAPQGIVVDRHVMTVLPPEHADGFESENVYMKGRRGNRTPADLCFCSGRSDRRSCEAPAGRVGPVYRSVGQRLPGQAEPRPGTLALIWPSRCDRAGSTASPAARRPG